ncbi:FecR family protein [Echinicola shivajiensis]|uniref:FecR family protein n=1 Tax=Echinicola shivajiensis TaxID=1035916 RepID=UPI001BFCACD2|nr:FecR domain-containing protein [Echinicola shivajiensis]
MNKDKLIRFLNKKASIGEQQDVSRWLEEPEAPQKLDAIMKENWELSGTSHNDEDTERILENIHRRIKKGNQRQLGDKEKKLWWPSLKIAASVLLVGLIAFAVYRQVYQLDVPEVKEELIVYTKEARSGEKLKLRLPDKTFVILNANSSLSYSSEFGKEIREVTLKGEAFFEVASDKNHPFKVKTEDLVTTALGTAFNAYSREGDVKVALTEGKVKVEQLGQSIGDSDVLLVPGQMASFTSEENYVLRVEDFEPSKVTVWKEGKIRFKSQKLKDVIDNLEQWYSIDIELSKGVKDGRKVSGLFNNESLENILNGLSFSLGIKYEIKENKVIIKP